MAYANSVIGARTNREGGPSALAAAIVGLAVVSIAAGYLPARRAANLDPVAALRAA